MRRGYENHREKRAAMDSSAISSPSSLAFSSDIDATLTLSDRLKAFKTSQFDPDAYVTSKCRVMNEKEIKHLCSYLVELKKASAEEMRKSVYANYGAFIRTSKEISDLEGQLVAMRHLLSSQAGYVHSLAEGIRIEQLSNDKEDSASDKTSTDSSRSDLSKFDNWLAEFLDTLQVLLAEKRVDEVLSVLEEGESTLEESRRRKALNSSALSALRDAIAENRQKLAEQLTETMSRASPRGGGVERRAAAQALKKLGDGDRAHTLLLASHRKKIQAGMAALRSPSGAMNGSGYTRALSKLVFSTIAQAVSDSLAGFREEAAYASELVTWAVRETEELALHLKRHVLVSSAASGGLRVAAECVHICLGHCSLLEARGLSLCSVLLRLFKPLIEQALGASLKRIEQSTAALASADDWSLVYPATGRLLGSASSLATAGANQPKLSSSAHKFNSMVQDFLDDVVPLESLQVDRPTLEGVLQLFNSYVNLMISALPGSVENEANTEGLGNKIVKIAETESQQIALLANASLLADEMLPRAALRLMSLQQSNNNYNSLTPQKGQNGGRLPEQREWKKRLQRSVDRLRDSFCRQHALELIFTDDGESRLCAQMYSDLDLHSDEPEWFPSPIFQVLFTKLTRIASISADVFIGRERFATVLLIRLLETVILWLSNDQHFWEEIESGQQPLGPRGLQQFYLDMEFVLLFSSQGRFLSRNMHQVIKEIIDRAIEAVEATGIDPYRVLPEGDWFAEVAQIAIKMLTGKANFDDIERDLNSPGSASLYSHGSHFE